MGLLPVGVKLSVQNSIRRTALRLLGAAAGSPSAQVQAALNNMFALSIGDRYPVTPAQMEANTSWVFAANRQIAGRAIRVKPYLEIVQRVDGGPAKRTPVHDHPILDLLQQPNPDETGRVFHYRSVVQYNTAGRVYMLVEPEQVDLSQIPALAALGAGRVTTRISRLKLLEPERVRVMSTIERRAGVFEYFDLYGGKYTYLAAPATWAEREAWKRDPYPFVIRVFVPAANAWNGQSVTEAAEWAVNTLFGLTQMWQNQLKNGLHAGLIFYLKKRNMDDVSRFEKAVALVKAGIGKAGEPLVLPEETVKVDPSPLDMQDMQFAELSKVSRQEVLSVLGANDGAVGLADAYNRANLDGLERIMAIGTVDPINAMIADALNAFLLPLYSGQSDKTHYELSYKSVAQADETTVMERLALAVTGGIYTPNEAREELGKKPKEGGDELVAKQKEQSPFGGFGGFGGPGAGLAALLPGAQVPKEAKAPAVEALSAAPAQPKLPKTTTGDTVEPRGAAADAAGKAPCGCKGRKAAAGAASPKVRFRLPEDHPLATKEGQRAKWRQLAQSRRVAEAALRRQLVPAFAAWRDQVLAALEKEGPKVLLTRPRADEPASPLDVSMWALQIAAAYIPWSRAWTEAVARRALEDLGLDAAQVDEMLAAAVTALEPWVAARANAMAGQVAATTAAEATDALEAMVAEGANLSAIADAVAQAFPASADVSRLRTIAATEAGIASGQALYGAAVQYRDALNLTDVSAPPTPAGADVAGGDSPDATDPLSEEAVAAATEAGFSVGDLLDAGTDGEGRPAAVGLQWLSRRDDRVRDSHVEADGQVVVLGELFTVGGCQMRFPGDDASCGDMSEIANCRCEGVVVPLDRHEVG